MSRFVQTVDSLFAESGPLSSFPQFEYRAQQHHMAVEIARGLEQGDHTILEAPTGVGKTLAYLLPAALFAVENAGTAIITTRTKNLQEQLIHNDIPIAQAILDRPCDAVLLKGRRNYLCTTRLRNAMTSMDSLFGAHAAPELQRIQQWSHETVDGDLEHLGFSPDPLVWDAVCSMPGSCSSAVCGRSCFYQQAHHRARRSPLVIMNHALFFTLVSLKGGSDDFVFPNDFVIIDEAHTIQAVAAAGLGKAFSRHQLISTLRRLYNSRTRRGLLARQKGGYKTLCSRTERDVTRFFESLRGAARGLLSPADFQRTSGTHQVRVPGPYLLRDTPHDQLEDLENRLRDLEERCGDFVLQQELVTARLALLETVALIDDLLTQTEPALTYWIEFGDRQYSHIAMRGSPTDISEDLREQLFRERKPVVMTSATLAVGADLQYFERQVGTPGSRSLILDSPFDFMRQLTIVIARDMPDPESRKYLQELPVWILRCIERTGGRSLVLFTNASLMQSVASRIAREMADLGLQLLVQGIERQRHELLEEFRRDIPSVLFGLDSFWSGVDVPGEALQQVIITRLPFSVPTHPLIQARLERISGEGGNAFLDYILPEAILRLRQGIGRLIRSRTDHGIVSILDSRILQKTYGRAFFSSLPRCPLEVWSATGAIEEITPEEW
ncbi:MAG: helicase C-terminal domain-containing protein [Bacteroidota bacterium]